MGIQVFTKSGKFNPVDHGLKIGDVINVIAVAGGGAGGASGDKYATSSNYDLAGGKPGKGDHSRGNTRSSGGGGTGAGYGAGGGGDADSEHGKSGGGGASGEIIFGTVKLTSLAPIDITVGLAGKRWEKYQSGTGTDDDNNEYPIYDYRLLDGTGGDSSFGSYITAKGGVGGRSGGIETPPFQGHAPGGPGNEYGGSAGGGGYIPGLPFWGGAGGGEGQNGGLLGGGGGGVKAEEYNAGEAEITDIIAGTSVFGGPGGDPEKYGVSAGIGDGIVIASW